MKAGKVLLTFCVTAFIAFAAYGNVMAQESKLYDSNFVNPNIPEKSGMLKGIKAGVGISNFTGADASGVNSRITLAVGGFVRYGSDRIAFQPEVWYIQKGGKVPMPGYTATLKFSYIDIPLLFKFPDPFSRRTARMVSMMYIGPVIGIKVSSKLAARDEGLEASIDLNNANSVDFGLAIGGDTYWPIGRTTKLFIDGRFAFSLTKSFKDAPYKAGNFVDYGGKAPRINHINFLIAMGLGF